MLDLLELSNEEWREWLVERGVPKFRAGQVMRWIFEGRAVTFGQMTDLPLELRSRLDEECCILTSRVKTRREADDGTEKLLLELCDGELVECVLLRNARGHRSICISTQVGCAMGCTFCASGLDGLVRNLTAGEIIEQMLHLQRLLPDDERLSHIVVMGMGEPMANLDNLLTALDRATITDGPDSQGLGIGARRVTISTVGLPAGVRRLAQRNRQYHLAISLHAADDETRNRLVPANLKAGIDEVLAAADDYFEMTGRRVTYEYVLLDKINDRPEDARRLVELLQNRNALVNLIPFNPVDGLEYRMPSKATVDEFSRILHEGRINVVIRYRRGEKIDAACGQLRRSS